MPRTSPVRGDGERVVGGEGAGRSAGRNARGSSGGRSTRSGKPTSATMPLHFDCNRLEGPRALPPRSRRAEQILRRVSGHAQLGRRTSSAPLSRARSIDLEIGRTLPSMSPTVGSIWASARRGCVDSAISQVWLPPPRGLVHPHRWLLCRACSGRPGSRQAPWRGADGGAHVEDLCRGHDIKLVRASSRGRAIRWRGGKLEISIPPVAARSPTSSRSMRSGTLSAVGARRRASSQRQTPGSGPSTKAWWSRLMPRSISRRLSGYLDWARNRQYRRVPPRIPARASLLGAAQVGLGPSRPSQIRDDRGDASPARALRIVCERLGVHSRWLP